MLPVVISLTWKMQRQMVQQNSQGELLVHQQRETKRKLEKQTALWAELSQAFFNLCFECEEIRQIYYTEITAEKQLNKVFIKIVLTWVNVLSYLLPLMGGGWRWKGVMPANWASDEVRQSELGYWYWYWHCGPTHSFPIYITPSVNAM